jgi:hypothetical protein
MDGLAIKVVLTEGDVEKIFPLRPRIIVAFEQKYNKGLAKLLSEDQKLEHIYWLGWEALKSNGHIVKPFGPEFLDSIKSVELLTDPSSESTESL